MTYSHSSGQIIKVEKEGVIFVWNTTLLESTLLCGINNTIVLKSRKSIWHINTVKIQSFYVFKTHKVYEKVNKVQAITLN